MTINQDHMSLVMASVAIFQLKIGIKSVHLMNRIMVISLWVTLEFSRRRPVGVLVLEEAQDQDQTSAQEEPSMFLRPSPLGCIRLMPNYDKPKFLKGLEHPGEVCSCAGCDQIRQDNGNARASVNWPTGYPPKFYEETPPEVEDANHTPIVHMDGKEWGDDDDF